MTSGKKSSISWIWILVFGTILILALAGLLFIDATTGF
jgi:flagellar basal body-associated protein FliL